MYVTLHEWSREAPRWSLGRAIAMGYLERARSANGTKVELLVRGNPVPAEIVPMPFVKHTYYRG